MTQKALKAPAPLALTPRHWRRRARSEGSARPVHGGPARRAQPPAPQAWGSCVLTPLLSLPVVFLAEMLEKRGTVAPHLLLQKSNNKLPQTRHLLAVTLLTREARARFLAEVFF